MEGQELFNNMMKNAIVYLQDEGYLPKQAAQSQNDPDGFDWDSPEGVKKQTEILQRAGLLPKK